MHYDQNYDDLPPGNIYEDDDNVYVDDVESYRGGGSRFSDYGRYELKDGLRDHEIMYLKLEGKPVRGMLIPQVNRSGTDTLPALVANPRMPLDAPPHRLYKLRGAGSAFIARFIGPRVDGNKNGLSFIDDYSPQEKAEALRTGKKLLRPPIQSAMSRARNIVEKNPAWMKFYKPTERGGESNRKNDWLRPPEWMFFIPMRVFSTHQFDSADCNENMPVDGIMTLPKSAYEGLIKAITRQLPIWQMPHFNTVEEGYAYLNTREAMYARFGYDLGDLNGAPTITFEGHKITKKIQANRRWAGKGAAEEDGRSRPMGNYYSAEVNGWTEAGLADEAFKFLNGEFANGLQFAKDMFIRPGDYLNFMSMTEIIDTIFLRSTDLEWSKFMFSCLYGTHWREYVSAKQEEFMAAAKAQSGESLYSDSMNEDGTYKEYPEEVDNLVDQMIPPDTMTQQPPQEAPPPRPPATAPQFRQANPNSGPPAQQAMQQRSGPPVQQHQGPPPVQQHQGPQPAQQQRQGPPAQRQGPPSQQAPMSQQRPGAAIQPRQGPPQGRQGPPAQQAAQPPTQRQGPPAQRQGPPRPPAGATAPQPPQERQVRQVNRQDAYQPAHEPAPWDEAIDYTSEALANDYEGDQDFPASYKDPRNSQPDQYYQNPGAPAEGVAFDPETTQVPQQSGGDGLDEFRNYTT